MNDVVKIPLKDLVFERALYPRPHVDLMHIQQFEHAMEAGIPLPPIIVAKGSNIIVEGVHRYHAYQNQGRTEIAAIVKEYTDNAAIWRDAVALNSAHGLKFGTKDQLHILQISERLGVEETELSKLLKTSIEHLRKLKPLYATVAEAVEGVAEARRVGLKGSVRHLAGETITAEQAEAMGRAPGPSYLLACNQLIDALNYDLLPPKDRHPVLWEQLHQLAEAILEKIKKGGEAA
jgi:ParB-like chromosome segregation protein Spo0J